MLLFCFLVGVEDGLCNKDELCVLASKTEEALKLFYILWNWLCFDGFDFLRISLYSLG